MIKSFVKISLGIVMLASTSNLLYSCKDKKKPDVVEPAPAPTEPASVTPTAPVVITADDSLRTKLVDALKDHPGVTATVNNGEITLTGEIRRPVLKPLMLSLQTLRPKNIKNELIIKD